MRKLLKYLKPYYWLLLLLLIFTLAQTYLNLSLPDYMAKIVNQGIILQKTKLIYQYGLVMLVITLFAGVFTVGANYLAAKICTGFAKKLRSAVFTKIEGFSLNEFNKFSTASLITRSTNDIQQIQVMSIMFLKMALMAPFMAVIAIFKAYSLAPSMSWIIVVSVVVLVSLMAIVFSIALPRFKRLQKLLDKLNLVTREILIGLRVIRAFGKEKVEEKKFNRANLDLKNLHLFVSRLMIILQPAIMLIMNVAIIAIVWFGSFQIDSGNLQIGSMLALMEYVMQAISAFLMISIIFINIPRAIVSLKRILEVLDTKFTINDPKIASQMKKIGGEVEFKNVTFIYNEAKEAVLKDISFVAKSGETTAIIGSTGSGKSTLINLIPRFYDVCKGSVLVNGTDVRDISQGNLRSSIGYVSQKAMLFTGTVSENISYGKENINDNEILKAADIAQASSFVNKLEKKYNNNISQAGSNLSGGQKQRIAIARALAKKPEIYIFDDTFSALDFKTEASLRQALLEETKNKTVLIIAQRINTIMSADKIIVLEEGKIVGQGNHINLLSTCKVYKEIALSQLSKDELGKINKKD